MKKFISFLSLITAVSFMMFACNRIDYVGYNGESVAQQNATAAQSITVTQDEAKGIADLFMHSEAGNPGAATKSADSSSKRVSSSATIREDGQDLMYVFNYEDGGFVIVGSTRNYYPILAYSDKGSFVLKEDMGPVDVWLDETKVNIKNSGSLDEETKAQMRSLWSRYDGTYVDPAQELLAARRPQTRSTGEDACWDRIDSLQALYGSEGWTFNSLSNMEYYFGEWGLDDLYDEICYYAGQNHSLPSETLIGYKYPVINQVGPLLETQWGQSSPFNTYCNGYEAGCGVIAAAQVVRYYGYPDTLSWNGVTFNVDDTDIPVEPNSTSKQAHFIRRIAQAIHVTYAEPGGNTAYPDQIAEGLNSLGYVAADTTHNYTKVKNQLLSYSRPVIMTGYINPNGTDGHGWVCDGAYEYIHNAITFFTENQPYGAGNFTQGMYSINNPGFGVGAGTGNTLLYFHMNWGWSGFCDEWYISDSANSGDGYNYQYLREDIFVRHINTH